MMTIRYHTEATSNPDPHLYLTSTDGDIDLKARFLQNFEPAAGSRVSVSEVRHALGSSAKIESSGRNFRPWLSAILGPEVQFVTRTTGGRSFLLDFRARLDPLQTPPSPEASSLNGVDSAEGTLSDQLVQLHAKIALWEAKPETFLHHLKGQRADVFVRPDYKPFYTLEGGVSGRRRFWSSFPTHSTP